MSLTTVQKYVVWKGKKSTYQNWKKKFEMNCMQKGADIGFELDEKDFPEKSDQDYDVKSKTFLEENNKAFK